MRYADNAEWIPNPERRNALKLQYLGTAAAEAIPAVFCNCEVCRKSRELGGRHLRTRSQALVNDDLLIDFPCDAYAHALRFGIDYSKIDHCIITHTHGDHLFPWELNHLKPHNQYERGVFHVFGSEDVEAAISGPVANAKGFLQFHRVEPFEPFQIGSYRITALKAAHGTAHPYIYLIEDETGSLLYAHDTDLFPEETMEYLKRVKPALGLISLDCTEGAHEDLNYHGHMCLGRNVRCRNDLIDCGVADENTVFVLNHFSHNGLSVGYDDFCALAEPLGFVVSYDGMTVDCIAKEIAPEFSK